MSTAKMPVSGVSREAYDEYEQHMKADEAADDSLADAEFVVRRPAI